VRNQAWDGIARRLRPSLRGRQDNKEPFFLASPGDPFPAPPEGGEKNKRWAKRTARHDKRPDRMKGEAPAEPRSKL